MRGARRRAYVDRVKPGNKADARPGRNPEGRGDLGAFRCRSLLTYPFEYRGTDFQCRVWRAIAGIPNGSTLTYIDIARQLRTAPRPVGGACGANRIPLVIPCHRVVGANGLGGFMNARSGAPLEIKRWLLTHEGAKH